MNAVKVILDQQDGKPKVRKQIRKRGRKRDSFRVEGALQIVLVGESSHESKAISFIELIDSSSEF